MAFDYSSIPSSMLDRIPTAEPPEGTLSNFVNPPSLDSQSKIITGLMLSITIIILLLRLYTRVRIMRSWGADDYLVIVSMVCVSGFCGVFMLLINDAHGEHAWDVPLSRLSKKRGQFDLVSLSFYGLAALFTKVTLLVFYLRIFSLVRYTRVLIWIGIAFTALFHVACTIATIVFFIPPKGTKNGWIDPAPEKVQKSRLLLPTTQSVVGVFLDFYILIIPMHLVVGLHLPLGRKLSVCGIFFTGFIACVCSIASTVYRFKFKDSRDMFWDAVPAYYLTVVELNVGIICSCLPILHVLLKRAMENETVVSMMRYLRTSHRTGEESKESNSRDQPKGSGGNRIRIFIPKPTMTGLRSFIRGAPRSQQGTELGNLSYGDLDSVTDDYHAQLREGQHKQIMERR